MLPPLKFIFMRDISSQAGQQPQGAHPASSAAEGNTTSGTCHHITSGQRCFLCEAMGLCMGPCCRRKMGLDGKVQAWAFQRAHCAPTAADWEANPTAPLQQQLCLSSMSPQNPAAQRQEWQLQGRHWGSLISKSSTQGTLHGSYTSISCWCINNVAFGVGGCMLALR